MPLALVMCVLHGLIMLTNQLVGLQLWVLHRLCSTVCTPHGTLLMMSYWYMMRVDVYV